MFWRRKSDGFEWQKHVRTTVKLRREDRRRRIDDAKVAAVEGFKEAGRAGVAVGSSGLALAGAGAAAAVGGLKDVGRAGVVAGGNGLAVAGAGAKSGLSAAKDGAGRAASASYAGLKRFGGASRDRVVRVARAVPPASARGWQATSNFVRRSARGPLQRWGVQHALLIGAALAAVFAGHGWTQGGLNPTVGLAAALAVVLVLIAVLPVLIGGQKLSFRWLADAKAWLMLRLEQLPWPQAVRGKPLAHLAGAGFAILLMATGVAAGGWAVWQGVGYVAGMSGIPGLASRVVAGRASAISGDTLRIGEHLIRLSGIEAPDRAQRCSRPGNRRWQCGLAARDALARAVRGGAVTCTIASSTDEAGRALGTCTVRDRDIAEGLVRDGHVFALSGTFTSTYGALETEAQAQKAGVWRGTAERPSEFRAAQAERRVQALEEAAKSAPNGCPIKGQVTSGRKLYVVPGASDYGRIRIRTSRGERWFCSEEEAVAAGWRLSPRS